MNISAEPGTAFDGGLTPSTVVTGGWNYVSVGNDNPNLQPTLTINLLGTHLIWYIELNHYSYSFYSTSVYDTFAYTIQVSFDNIEWTNVIEVTDNTIGQTSHALMQPVSGSYLRLVLNQPNNLGNPANKTLFINEFQIMGQRTS